jgi:hypothetical protein
MELEDSQDYYFRIVAVDKSGNASDPSDGQSALANLIAEANIADATITTAKIGEAQITNALIADATITSAKINDLTADKITAGTIDASVITVTNLSASNITSGTISADRISGGSISADLISGGSISADLISGGSISADLISGGTINGDNITVTNLNADNITTGSLNGNQIENNAISSSKIQNSAVTNDKIDSVEFGKVTAFSVSANDITSGTMSADRISGGSINANIITGTASLDGLNVGNGGAGFGGTVNLAGNTLTQVGQLNAVRLDTSTNVDADGWVAGDDFRGNGTTVNIYRNFSSNGIRVSGSGSGAYLYGFNSSGSLQTIYSPYSGVSDERLKENVADLTLGLEEINALRPVTFDWKSTQIEDVPTGRYGFIAQEVESVVPSMISTEPSTRIEKDAEDVEIEVDNFITLDDGTEVSEWKRIDKKPLLYMLVKAVQELSEKNEELTARIEVLEG